MDRAERKKMKQDEFVESTWNVLHYVEEHPRPFLYGALAVVVAVVVVWAIMGQVRAWSGRSADLLAQGQAALDAPVVATGAQPNDPYRPSFASEQQRGQQAAERLAKAGKSSGTVGDIAGYLRGVALLQAGDAKSAVSQLQDSSKELGQDATLGSSVKAALAAAYDAAGQPDKAADTWRALSSDAAGYPRELALAGLGQALAHAGKRDEAKATLNQVVTEYPNSPAAATAKQELDKLGA